jgi:nicotinate-nucleotide adenylyltransferase
VTLAVYYGGTFDPVHAGHLAVAAAARDVLSAPVIFVPAADPPHRPAPGASAEHRARMLDLAIHGQPGFRIDRRELHRDGPSWTVVTLEGLRAEHGPQRPLAWLVGTDAFLGLPGWHRWREIGDLAHLVVALRPGHSLEALPPELAAWCDGRWTGSADDLRHSPAGRVHVLWTTSHPASATVARDALRTGADAGDWLPPAVADHIARYDLYTGDAHGAGV